MVGHLHDVVGRAIDPQVNISQRSQWIVCSETESALMAVAFL